LQQTCQQTHEGENALIWQGEENRGIVGALQKKGTKKALPEQG
jgi:hypothetical protein